jgi:hypothetical protein
VASRIEAELESELDRLYGLPLEDFVKERDALAKRARQEDQQAIAGRIKALRKPTVATWVINRLARENELDVQRLLKAGEQLTEAQLAALAGRDPEAFSRARKDEQDALRRLASAAEAIIERESIGAGTLERITRTLRAAATSEDARRALKQGRLTEDLEPQGFETLAAVAPKARAASSGRRADTGQAAKTRALSEARERARAAAKRARELDRKAHSAERAADQAEAEARKSRDYASKLRGEAAAAAEASAEARAELATIDPRKAR